MDLDASPRIAKPGLIPIDIVAAQKHTIRFLDFRGIGHYMDIVAAFGEAPS